MSGLTDQSSGGTSASLVGQNTLEVNYQKAIYSVYLIYFLKVVFVSQPILLPSYITMMKHSFDSHVGWHGVRVRGWGRVAGLDTKRLPMIHYVKPKIVFF